MPRSNGPFEVIDKIGPNSNKIDLPRDYRVSSTFNVANLSPYYDEVEEFSTLRSNSNQSTEYDGNHPLEAFGGWPKSHKDPTSTKEIRKVHALVQEVTKMPLHLLSYSNRNWPSFVQPLSNEGQGMIDYLDHRL